MRTQTYRQNTSRNAEMLATFRQQMADYVRGERLRALRKAAHLSQEEAAHQIQVSAKTYRTWEKGGGIRWPNALKVATFFNVDPESLVSRDEDAALIPDLSAVGDDQLDRIERTVSELAEAVQLLAADNAKLRRTLEEMRGTGRRKTPKADGAR